MSYSPAFEALFPKAPADWTTHAYVPSSDEERFMAFLNLALAARDNAALGEALLGMRREFGPIGGEGE